MITSLKSTSHQHTRTRFINLIQYLRTNLCDILGVVISHDTALLDTYATAHILNSLVLVTLKMHTDTHKHMEKRDGGELNDQSCYMLFCVQSAEQIVTCFSHFVWEKAYRFTGFVTSHRCTHNREKSSLCIHVVATGTVVTVIWGRNRWPWLMGKQTHDADA